MKLKSVSLTCFVLMFTIAVFGQTNKAVTDRVSGNWGDPKGPGFELKFDGKRAVSGTIRIVNSSGFSTAPVKTGTFDSKTGALKLEGEAKRPDGTTSHFVIEGILDKTTVSGTYNFDNNKGDFKFIRTSQ